jgi:hypothetical protein
MTQQPMHGTLAPASPQALRRMWSLLAALLCLGPWPASAAGS